ncbi:MAG: HAMP domain-containing sensor histidine kinase [Candidatus Caenarcaniphilales bacterium]|nr:HAMP domain-containing sensor histidine kinase [Candidatus Caenarcaniphilales bacterium]
MPETNSNLFRQIFANLKAGIVVFENDQILEINDNARKLLKLEEDEEALGPYKQSLEALLKLDENGYSKQLTGPIGKPLSATLHLFDGKKVIELHESFETKFGEASHELRRPLTNIKTLVDTLFLWGAGEDPQARPKFLKQLHQEVDRVVKLVNDLLDLSRIQAGSIPLRFQQVALKALVQETFSMLESQAEQKQVSLLNEVDDNYVLIADLDKLSHIVQNLIENGIRYNVSGGKVVVRPGDQPNSFVVADTGTGIAPENHHLIFERFKRINREVPGTGLGLAIVKSIVDLHGGTIDLKSNLGEGTEFIVSIPPHKIALAPL